MKEYFISKLDDIKKSKTRLERINNTCNMLGNLYLGVALILIAGAILAGPWGATINCIVATFIMAVPTFGIDFMIKKIIKKEAAIEAMLEQKFFLYIKDHKEQMQYLADLVVDNKTHTTFKSIVEKIKNVKDNHHYRFSDEVQQLMDDHHFYIHAQNKELSIDNFLKQEDIKLQYGEPRQMYAL